MTLAELTDSHAVLAALDECDELGRTRFLERYGFGEARTYFLEYGGRRYDSKAIAGVAHRHQFGVALRASEFSGGDLTVAKKLAELGFVVTRPAPSWSMPIGAITTRTEVKNEYGGSIYGGIEPSTTSPNVLLYSDPEQGEEHGYRFDEWLDDEPGAFAYTGEGKYGDQVLADGNRAVVDHVAMARVLRLFFTLPGPTQPGGKRQQYVGAFRLDADAPFDWRVAPDSNGESRKVVVFRLLPDEVDSYPSAPVKQPVPSVGASRKQAAPERAVKMCPIHFLELSVSGTCDFCDG